MDESKYLLWLKRKQMLMKSSQVQLQAAASMRTVVPIVGDSWEEQAFAEDAAGPLGGCIWPPRSYSCSFCRREFRSAQALGGHMNVHRRDRARLKQQSPSPLSCEQSSSLLVASSSAPPQDNYTSAGEYTFLSPVSHPNRRNDFLENHKGLSPYSSAELGFESTDEMENYYSAKKEEEESAKLCISNNKKGFVDTNLGLNLQAVAVNNNNSSDHQQGYYDEVIRCKRQKTHVYLMKPYLLQSNDFKGLIRRNSMDELDLELRLGDPTMKVL